MIEPEMELELTLSSIDSHLLKDVAQAKANAAGLIRVGRA
jgi:hypothetical protein